MYTYYVFTERSSKDNKDYIVKIAAGYYIYIYITSSVSHLDNSVDTQSLVTRVQAYKPIVRNINMNLIDH